MQVKSHTHSHNRTQMIHRWDAHIQKGKHTLWSNGFGDWKWQMPMHERTYTHKIKTVTFIWLQKSFELPSNRLQIWLWFSSKVDYNFISTLIQMDMNNHIKTFHKKSFAIFHNITLTFILGGGGRRTLFFHVKVSTKLLVHCLFVFRIEKNTHTVAYKFPKKLEQKFKILNGRVYVLFT